MFLSTSLIRCYILWYEHEIVGLGDYMSNVEVIGRLEDLRKCLRNYYIEWLSKLERPPRDALRGCPYIIFWEL